MKANDVRKKSPGDLKKLLAETEAELRAFKFGMTGGKSKNIRASRALRKTIARIKTLATENK